MCGEKIADRLVASPEDQAVSRYLGLSLGGAKSERTCLAVVDYYRRQQKAFVVDIFPGIGPEEKLTADQALLELIAEVSHELTGAQSSGVRVMGVDAPLTLPPCLTSCEPGCKGYEECAKPEVRWMRREYLRARARGTRIKHFTPYSQRPVDLYFRCRFPHENLFQDETMGANLAPQAARMSYLKNFLRSLPLVEVWPKLALYHLQRPLRQGKRELLSYRHVGHGAHVREAILERLVEKSDIFVYERDMRKFVTDVSAFDSLLCAWVAMQFDLGRVVRFKGQLPLDSGWVQIPEL